MIPDFLLDLFRIDLMSIGAAWTHATLLWIAGAEWLRVDLLGRLMVAALLGGAVGMEREMRGKPAGFRTNMLIAIGACLLTDLSIEIAEIGNRPNADPGRIASYIVGGIGFLGAGVIWQSRGHVVGITTAATIWVVAAIGIAVGANMLVPAIGTTLFVMGALSFLGRTESRFRQRPHPHRVQVRYQGGPRDLDWLKTTMRDVGLQDLTFQRARFEREANDGGRESAHGLMEVTFSVLAGEDDLTRALEELMQVDEIRGVRAE